MTTRCVVDTWHQRLPISRCQLWGWRNWRRTKPDYWLPRPVMEYLCISRGKMLLLEEQADCWLPRLAMEFLCISRGKMSLTDNQADLWLPQRVMEFRYITKCKGEFWMATFDDLLLLFLKKLRRCKQTQLRLLSLINWTFTITKRGWVWWLGNSSPLMACNARCKFSL